MRSPKAKTNANWTSTESSRKTHADIFSSKEELAEIAERMRKQEEVTMKEYNQVARSGKYDEIVANYEG